MKNFKFLKSQAISYFAIYAVVTLVFGIGLYNSMITSVIKSRESAYENRIKTAAKNTESYITSLWDNANNISGIPVSPELLFGMQSVIEYEEEVKSSLLKIVSNNVFIEGAALYIRGENSIISTDGKTSLFTFNGKMWRYDNWNLTDFRRDINEISSFVIRQSEGVYINNDISPTKLITFLFPIPMSDLKPKATFIIMAREYMFTLPFDEVFEGREGLLCLMGAGNEIIATSKNDVEISEDAIKQHILKTNYERFSLLKAGGNEFVTYRTSSFYNGMHYFIAIPRNVFYKAVSDNAKLFYFIIFISGALVLLMIFLILKNRKKRFYMIARQLNKEKDIGQSYENFDLLYDAMLHLIENENDAGALVDSKGNALKEQLLLGMALGNISLKAYEKAADFLNIRGLAKFRIFVVSIFGEDAEFDDINIDLSEQLSHIKYDGIGILCVNHIVENQFVLLVYSNDADFEFSAAVCRDIADGMSKELTCRNINDFMISAGSCYAKISKCNLSYINAITAMEKAQVEKHGNIAVYDGLMSGEGKLVLEEEKYLALKIALGRGSFNAASEILSDIIDDIAENYCSVLISKMQCFDLVNALLKYSQNLGQQISHSDIERILDYKSLNELKKMLTEICFALCNAVTESKDYEKSRQEKELTSFVQEHYCDSSFSLNKVAEHFNMSTAYASSFFKTIMGDTFINCITKLRMDRIKLLLRTTNMKIKDIVESSGYIDVSNFTRKFKAVEKITLSEYRKGADNDAKTQNTGDDAEE